VASEAIRLMKGNARALSRFARVLSYPDHKNRCNALAIKAVELAKDELKAALKRFEAG